MGIPPFKEPAALHQNVHFKAQLFTPLQMIKDSFDLVNNECIEGFYIRPHEIDLLLKNHKFYIPSKLDWLVKPHSDVNWLNISTFKTNIYHWIKLC